MMELPENVATFLWQKHCDSIFWKVVWSALGRACWSPKNKACFSDHDMRLG